MTIEGMDPARWGIAPGFYDIAGRWHDTPPWTGEAFLAAMGADGDEPPPPALVTVRTDHELPPLGPGRIVCEDGAEIAVEGEAPPDLPPGYHRLVRPDGRETPLIVSPGRVPYPQRRAWGFATQLYATRSRGSWGVGDLADLARLGRWSAGLGAGFTLVSPLHAATPGAVMQPSPYYPGSRCFANPVYIAVGDVPGAASTEGFEAAAAAGRALNAERLIDRDRAWKLKSAVLEKAFAGPGGESAGAAARSRELDRYRAERGRPLERFATYCALAEIHGPVWRTWPAGLRHPDRPAVARFAASPEGARRVAYHAWLQWQLDCQLSAAAAGAAPAGLVADLAVGVDPTGPDSWVWQDTFARGVRVGAPPDEFNTGGQDWGLPPFDPWRLRSAGYAPYVEALRAGLRHCSGLRVDHVMGLFRLYWIPDGHGPAEGGYVYYPHHDLLNILALEAQRAGAYVVGEDLGTVEDEVRRDLAERRVLSYRLWWFEPDPPATWPEAAMGAVTTHDLPTVAGVVTGSDLEAQRGLGLHPNEEASSGLVAKVAACSGGSTNRVEAIVATYRNLAAAPCALLAVTLDDAIAVEERPNMPGTTDAWPNWCLALPLPLEEIEEEPLTRRVAAEMQAPPP